MPAADFFTPRVRSIALLVTSVGGFLTAVGAYARPQSHDVTRVSYEELSQGMEKLTGQMSQNHDDIVLLRGYIARMDGQVLMTPIPLDAGAESPTAAPAAAWKKPAVPVATLPKTMASVEAPPPVHDEVVYRPPVFSAILKKAGK